MTVVVERGAVARVRMNRPEVFNAFDEAMISALHEAFATLAEDPAVRVIVLEGAGKAFSAGADLQSMQRASTASQLLVGGPQAQREQREIKQLFAQLEVVPITEEVRELTAQTIARVRTTPEARKGFEAFLAKRPASWIPKA